MDPAPGSVIEPSFNLPTFFPWSRNAKNLNLGVKMILLEDEMTIQAILHFYTSSFSDKIPQLQGRISLM